jgi:hypothetical protein
MNYDGVLLSFLEREDAENVLRELHSGPAGGHLVGETTSHKILREGYYCLNMFRSANIYVRK